MKPILLLLFFAISMPAQTLELTPWIWSASSSGDLDVEQVESELNGDGWVPGIDFLFGTGALKLGLSAFQLELDGAADAERPIEVAGFRFNAAARADTKLEMTNAKLFLRYRIGNEAASISLEGGGLYADIAGAISVFGFSAVDESATVVLPYGGLHGRVQFHPSFQLRGGFRLSSWEYDGIDTSWSELDAGVLWQPRPNLGLGAAYRRLAIDASSPEREIGGDLVFEGPSAFIQFAW